MNHSFTSPGPQFTRTPVRRSASPHFTVYAYCQGQLTQINAKTIQHSFRILQISNPNLAPLLDGDFWQRCNRNSFKLFPNFNALLAAIFVYHRILILPIKADWGCREYSSIRQYSIPKITRVFFITRVRDNF